MLDINSLYSAVFPTAQKRFDPTKSYYSILIDTLSFAPLYPMFRSRIEYLLPQSQVAFVHPESEEDLTVDAIDVSLSTVAEELEKSYYGEPPKRHYCIFTYLDESGNTDPGLMQLLSAIEVQPQDHLTVFLCIAARLKGAEDVLDAVAAEIYRQCPNAGLYLFSALSAPYYRRQLVDDLCAAVILNADFGQCAARKSRIAVADRHINEHVNRLGSDGAAYVASLLPIQWSTVHVAYSDRRHDFLKKYLADACENLAPLSRSAFKELCGGLCKEVFPQPELRQVKAPLLAAVDAIPTVIPTPNKKPTGTLHDYFIHLFGEKGSFYVDLTLRATLSGILTPVSETAVKAMAERLLARCSAYHSLNLHEEVMTLLEGYLADMKKNDRMNTGRFKDILYDDMSAERYVECVEEYIEKYYEVHMLQSELLFWDETLRYIATHKDDFAKDCAHSKEMAEQIELLKEETKGAMGEGLVYKTDYSASALLSITEREEDCQRIKAIFDALEPDAYVGKPPSNWKDIFKLNLDPNFYRTESISLSAMSYTLLGAAYNGRYLVHFGGNSHV